MNYNEIVDKVDRFHNDINVTKIGIINEIK